MPSLMLRSLPADLVGRVKQYARERELSLPEAAAHLLAAGLDHLEARAAGAQAVNAGKTKAERSKAAQHAAQARWSEK